MAGFSRHSPFSSLFLVSLLACSLVLVGACANDRSPQPSPTPAAAPTDTATPALPPRGTAAPTPLPTIVIRPTIPAATVTPIVPTPSSDAAPVGVTGGDITFGEVFDALTVTERECVEIGIAPLSKLMESPIGQEMDVRAMWEFLAALAECAPDVFGSDSTPSGILEDFMNAMNATPVKIGEAVPAVLDHEHDWDLFVFSASEGQVYLIETTLGSLHHPMLEVFDSRYELLVSVDDHGADLAAHLYWQAPESGDYWVGVSGYEESDYAFSVTVSDVKDDHANTIMQATFVRPGQDVDGRVDYSGDVDYFRLQAAEGALYWIETVLDTPENSELELYDADGELCGPYVSSTTGFGTRLKWQATGASSCYIAVSGYDVGSYSLSVKEIEDDHGDARDDQGHSIKQWSSPPPMTIDPASSYTAVLNTSAGSIAVELLAGEAPNTVNNFVFLARQGFYDNVIFHRTIEGFMIQGGDPTGTGAGGPGYQFADEQVQRPYSRGVMAMANAGPNTNGSQFFIMHTDYPLPPNYTIFGQTVSGLETIDAIATAPTQPEGEGSAPVNPVVIQSVKIIGPSDLEPSSQAQQEGQAIDEEREPAASQVSQALLANLARHTEEGLVELTAYQTEKRYLREGSGFIFETYGSRAFVVTYYPFVEFDDEIASSIEVRVGKANVYRATVVGYDSDRYVVVLSICCDEDFTALEVETSIRPPQGESVVAVSYPEFPQSSADGCATVPCAMATAGRVISLEEEWFIHDAPLTSAYFGGPLLSEQGKVWGVNVGLSNEEGFYTFPNWRIRELLSERTAAPTLTSTVDYDTDDDGLIEISNLEQLDSMRYDLDGDGEADNPDHASAFPNALAGMGCPSLGCTGYELTANLDFDTNGNGKADDGDTYWNDGSGWVPVGDGDHKFTATFDGNGNTIANLYINGDLSYVGLFGMTGIQSNIKRIGLTSVEISNASFSNSSGTGSLVGLNQGEVSNSYAVGEVFGIHDVGGLVGVNVGKLSASYAEVSVLGRQYYTGGLVGQNAPGALINMSYATGDVTAQGDETGGLAGGSNGGSTIIASYATGNVSGVGRGTGGLVGQSWYTTIVNCYAIGEVSSLLGDGGGLVGDRTGGEIRDSYWNTQTSGRSDSAGGEGKTTLELKAPTSASGIYANWNAERWDFGDSNQYPALMPVKTADADRNRPDLYSPISPPVAPSYMDWRWESGQGGFREVVTDITIHNDVGDWSDQHGYYLVLMQNSISGVGFYFGLQTDVNSKGKGLIFSRWGTRDLANARFPKDDGWTQSSGHQGDFIGVRRSYDWGPGDYRVRIAPDSLEDDGEWFGLWITDLSNDETTWVGSLKFPLSGGTALMEPHSSATIDFYGIGPVRPIDLPRWHVSVRRPMGDGVPATWGFTSYPFDESPDALFNSNVRYEQSEGQVHIVLGGTTERRDTPERMRFQ